MTRAALAAGADGVLIEVHPNPARALKDGAQSLTPDTFRELMRTLRPLAEVMGRRL
jgi:3-deoxy-7-phosphoheptulonate synthase